MPFLDVGGNNSESEMVFSKIQNALLFFLSFMSPLLDLLFAPRYKILIKDTLACRQCVFLTNVSQKTITAGEEIKKQNKTPSKTKTDICTRKPDRLFGWVVQRERVTNCFSPGIFHDPEKL